MAFTQKMRAFADEWLTGEHTGKRFNGTEAARHAGYSLPPTNKSIIGSRLLRHPEVQKYIKERLDEFTMSAEEVLIRFTKVARSEMGDVLRLGAHGELELDPDKVLEKRELIRNFSIDSNGNPKVEFHDAMQALRDIARIRGMLKDTGGLELGGLGSAPVHVQVTFVRPDGEVFNPTGKEQGEKQEEDFSDLEAE